MSREKKLLVFVILVAVVAIFLVIYRYEMLLVEKDKDMAELNKVLGGVRIKKEYTAQEIIQLIKSSPSYLGDSLVIYENGDMLSSNDKFNGTLQAVITSKGNMTMVKNEMKKNKLPLQYNIYALASIYYKQQYPDEVKPVIKTDSVKNVH
jgi:hypothetical protein